jgi:hypothetical protein
MEILFEKKIRDTIVTTPKEVALYFGKSLSWVYKNQNELGVRKLRGSLFFPKKEELYERLFCKKEEPVEIRLYPERKKVHGNLVQNEDRCETSRSKKKRGNKITNSNGAVKDNSNRYGLLDIM